MRSASTIFMSCTEAIPQIITLQGCEEKLGDQRGTKVARTVAAAVGERHISGQSNVD